LKIGCHVSIAGGIDNSVIRAEELGCNTMQIFSKNAATWQEKILDQEEVKRFKRNLKNSILDIDPVFIHTSYLINLASPLDELYFKSINSFIEEMKRANLLLAVPYLITHPGAHIDRGEEYGIQRIIRALNIILEKSADLNLKTMILLVGAIRKLPPQIIFGLQVLKIQQELMQNNPKLSLAIFIVAFL